MKNNDLDKTCFDKTSSECFICPLRKYPTLCDKARSNYTMTIRKVLINVKVHYIYLIEEIDNIISDYKSQNTNK